MHNEIIRAHTNKDDSVIRSTIKIVYLSKITGNVNITMS